MSMAKSMINRAISSNLVPLHCIRNCLFTGLAFVQTCSWKVSLLHRRSDRPLLGETIDSLNIASKNPSIFLKVFPMIFTCKRTSLQAYYVRIRYDTATVYLWPKILISSRAKIYHDRTGVSGKPFRKE